MERLQYDQAFAVHSHRALLKHDQRLKIHNFRDRYQLEATSNTPNISSLHILYATKLGFSWLPKARNFETLFCPKPARKYQLPSSWPLFVS